MGKALGNQRVDVVDGRAVEEGEVGGVEAEPLFEQFECAVPFDQAVEPFEDEPLVVGTIAQFVEFGGLGGFEEVPKFGGVEGEVGVEVG